MMQTFVGVDLGGERVTTGSFEPRGGVALGQVQQAQTSAVSLLRVQARAQDGPDELGGVWANLFGPTLEVAPIATQASLSSDGALVLIREEGWKEVKVIVVLEARVAEADARVRDTARPSRRARDVESA
jgi:hypothetical protein